MLGGEERAQRLSWVRGQESGHAVAAAVVWLTFFTNLPVIARVLDGGFEERGENLERAVGVERVDRQPPVHLRQRGSKGSPRHAPGRQCGRMRQDAAGCPHRDEWVRASYYVLVRGHLHLAPTLPSPPSMHVLLPCLSTCHDIIQTVYGEYCYKYTYAATAPARTHVPATGCSSPMCRGAAAAWLSLGSCRGG